MNLIERDDPRYFTQTSNEPYDRHNYLIHFKNKMPHHVDSWEQVQSTWWNTDSSFLSHVEVLNNPNYEESKPKSKSKGFK